VPVDNYPLEDLVKLSRVVRGASADFTSAERRRATKNRGMTIDSEDIFRTLPESAYHTVQPPLEPFYTNESDLKESDIPTTKTEGRGVVLAATINKFNAATV
jgi:hypothetical protein